MGQTRSTIGFGIHPFQDASLTDEFYEEEFAIDTSEFNIYAAEWNPDGVTFYINNLKIKTIEQSPQYPMQFMLSIYDVLEGKQRQEKMEFIVDYVYGYRSVKS
jgi:beta-glucanase (GH16 family)